MAYAKKLDIINVIDLESTCWEGGIPPSGEVPEIIQLGWCRLNTEDMTIISRGSINIRPMRSTISEYCTNLTGITPEIAAKGVHFSQLQKYLFQNLASRKCVWSSWSEGDKESLLRHCAEYKMDMPFGDTHFDAQMFAALSLRLPIRPGLMSALQACGLVFEGVQHRGEDDAFNTARVIRACMLRGK